MKRMLSVEHAHTFHYVVEAAGETGTLAEYCSGIASALRIKLFLLTRYPLCRQSQIDTQIFIRPEVIINWRSDNRKSITLSVESNQPFPDNPITFFLVVTVPRLCRMQFKQISYTLQQLSLAITSTILYFSANRMKARRYNSKSSLSSFEIVYLECASSMT